MEQVRCRHCNSENAVVKKVKVPIKGLKTNTTLIYYALFILMVIEVIREGFRPVYSFPPFVAVLVFAVVFLLVITGVYGWMKGYSKELEVVHCQDCKMVYLLHEVDPPVWAKGWDVLKTIED